MLLPGRPRNARVTVADVSWPPLLASKSQAWLSITCTLKRPQNRELLTLQMCPYLSLSSPYILQCPTWCYLPLQDTTIRLLRQAEQGHVVHWPAGVQHDSRFHNGDVSNNLGTHQM